MSVASSSNSVSSTRQNVTLPDIPQLFNPNYLDILLPPSDEETYEIIPASDDNEDLTNTLMKALQSTAYRTKTENGANAFSSTLSATLDAFTGLGPTVNGSRLNKLLSNAWKEDPLITLKIIFHLRSIHEGKGERLIFYRAYGWLLNNHPRTAIANLHVLVDPVCEVPPKTRHGETLPSPPVPHGYYKDLLNILCLATLSQLSGGDGTPLFLESPRQKFTYRRSHARSLVQTARENGTLEDAQKRIQKGQEKTKSEQARANATRAYTNHKRHRLLLEKLKDKTYLALYITVARLFTHRLAEDLKIVTKIRKLEKKDPARIDLMKQISLAGKWAPTPGSSHDRVTNIATAISLLIHRSQIFHIYPAALSNPATSEVERAMVLRSFYQRWVLTELRKGLAIPEPLMCANKWSSIRYNRVSSLAMKVSKHAFIRHDEYRFEEYLNRVKKGKSSMSGATLFPHELVAQALAFRNGGACNQPKNRNKKQNDLDLRVIEEQWSSLTSKLRQAGTLEGSLAVCDVSGSMGDIMGRHNTKSPQPILPAIALSLLLATVAEHPFNGGFITFSERPQFLHVSLEQSLYDQVMSMAHSGWGMSTNFTAIFTKLLLPLAIENKVPKDKMIKRLFVFSDMQFDGSHKQGHSRGWETNYDIIERAYKNAGYDVPQIIFWDLSSGGSSTHQVQAERKGVALVNGFSSAMMKTFMREREIGSTDWEEISKDGGTKSVGLDAEFTPLNVMKHAVCHQSFDGLVILD